MSVSVVTTNPSRTAPDRTLGGYRGRLAAGRRWRMGATSSPRRSGRPSTRPTSSMASSAPLPQLASPVSGFHDLRHAFATLLLESGEELGVVSMVLGPSNLSTTADVYAHLTPAMSQRVADRLDGVLRRAQG